MDHLPASSALKNWLSLCIFLVALMVLIGGATRLTESGLSIVQWKLVSGILPPANEAAWQREFFAYRTSPQYKDVNAGFSLADFKHIYWLEYLHRLLGRITALAFLLPLFYFAARRQISKPLARRMAAAFVLIALQGAVGWVMVASGLVNTPHVDPLKLALHLSLAFALFGLLLWTRWQMSPTPRLTPHRGVALAARALMALLALQIVMGALVAGAHAGYIYNTFPRMEGKFIPNQLGALAAHWQNHIGNMLLVQFQHRLGAMAVFLGSLAFVGYAWKHSPQHRLLTALLAAVLLQCCLGVATLLTVVNPRLASLHQLMALVLFGLVLRAIYLHPPARE